MGRGEGGAEKVSRALIMNFASQPTLAPYIHIILSRSHLINWSRTREYITYVATISTTLYYYQPAVRFTLRLLCVFRVCWYYIYICASALITCTIITSHSLHCWHATLLQQFRRLFCVATTSSLAQFRVQDGYREAETTQTRRREADRERKRQKRAATRGAYRDTNQQTTAARRALEWI